LFCKNIKYKKKKGYEEFIIPPKKAKNDGIKLIPTTVFEDWARLAFKGVEYLNRVQSKVYHTAYKTNENLLICAPTGILILNSKRMWKN
jgi:replicative superfamily II helicase